jgi:hypothetical protein
MIRRRGRRGGINTALRTMKAGAGARTVLMLD